MKHTLRAFLALGTALCLAVPAAAADLGPQGDDYAVGPNGLLRRIYVDAPDGAGVRARFEWSADGRTWTEVTNTPWSIGSDRISILPSSGKDFFVCDGSSGDLYASADGAHWTTLAPENGTWHTIEGVSAPLYASYTFRWTGDAYLVTQNVGSSGGMFGFGAMSSPRNTVLTVLDEDWNEVASYDLGAFVRDAVAQDGTWYAATAAGEDDTVIWSSTDRAAWAETGLTALPRNDEAGGLRFSARGTEVQVSDDGVYWTKVPDVSLREGAVLSVQPIPGAETAVIGSVERDGPIQWTGSLVDLDALRAELTERFAAERYYVRLDGTLLSFDAAPMAEHDRILVPLRGIAEALGFSVDWEEETGRAVCTKGGREIAVSLGTADVWVDGEAQTLDVSSQVRYDRTYVPLRFLSEGFGLTVDWDSESSTVLLTA